MIEVVITVAILAVLSSVAVPAFAVWMERNRVRSAAESIHSGIQVARAEALARNAAVRFTLQTNGNWSIACTGTSPGCPTTDALHFRTAEGGRGRYALLVNGAAIAAASGVTFSAQGRPDATEADRIAQVEVVLPTDMDSAGTERTLRVVASDFGRTRMCYPHAVAGSPTRC